MPIDPVLAETLRIVAEEGTLEAAARRQHMTASAVSQRLRLLEQQLGQRLLVRAKPARLTEPGQAVVRFARRHALIEHEALAELGLEARGESPRLSIAVNSDSMATWFLGALAGFARRHDAQLELLREDQDATARHLASGAAVAAVTSSPVPSPGCSVTALGSLVYVAAAAPAWWERWIGPSDRAQTTRVTAEALTCAPRIDFDRSDELQATWLRRLGVDPAGTPRHFVPSTHDLAAAVEAGLGWGMLLTFQADPLLASGRLLPLGGEPVTPPLFWQVAKTPSRLLDELTEAVVSTARRELRQE
ncbi:ArgP/LysG family DNA-binding transcriptional regulator [Brachybacterium hainanense]|uniref:ArgP/LysG family DNA-binding transcriptional regulator n=1 Tax=Brachybacterium hainanense TaxID=1541174 RepID=A0ABV6RBR0_9MICO